MHAYNHACNAHQTTAYDNGGKDHNPGNPTELPTIFG